MHFLDKTSFQKPSSILAFPNSRDVSLYKYQEELSKRRVKADTREMLGKEKRHVVMMGTTGL